MQKYLAIIDRKTGYLFLLCSAVTYLCFQFNFNYDLNVTLISIAIIFPLVFTIREAFKRRTAIIKLLSVFKSSLNAVYYCFSNNEKLSDEDKKLVAEKLLSVSHLFFDSLTTKEPNTDAVRSKVNEVFEFLYAKRSCISNGVALKIIRFLKDVDESIENTVGLKLHGTPISLRAYCLVFIFLFPCILIPTLVHDLASAENWIVYFLAVTHGFILISLYNVQDHMENPFDQIGLDDIKLEGFHFNKDLALIENRRKEATAAISQN